MFNQSTLPKQLLIPAPSLQSTSYQKHPVKRKPLATPQPVKDQ
jgi:hypothetical protein